MRWQDWVQGQAAYAALGLGGARHWDVPTKVSRFFILVMVLLAVGLLLQWQLTVRGYITPLQSDCFNWLIWFGFLIDFLVPLRWAKERWRYSIDSWMIILILLIGSPLLFHLSGFLYFFNTLRPFLALYILIPSFSMLLSFLVDGKLLTTLFAAGIVVVVFGILIAGIDPNIPTAWDGIWWATATISTVGYGDVVPSTFFSRLLGIVLVVIGMGIFVVLTANILAMVLNRQKKRRQVVEHDVHERLKRLEVNQKFLIELIKANNKKH